MSRSAPLWSVALASAVGLAVGLLINLGSQPAPTAPPEDLPPGVAFVVLTDPALPEPAVFARGGGDHETARYTYTFRHSGDASAAVLAARQLFAAQYRRVLDGE